MNIAVAVLTIVGVVHCGLMRSQHDGSSAIGDRWVHGEAGRDGHEKYGKVVERHKVGGAQDRIGSGTGFGVRRKRHGHWGHMGHGGYGPPGFGPDAYGPGGFGPGRVGAGGYGTIPYGPGVYQPGGFVGPDQLGIFPGGFGGSGRTDIPPFGFTAGPVPDENPMPSGNFDDAQERNSITEADRRRAKF